MTEGASRNVGTTRFDGRLERVGLSLANTILFTGLPIYPYLPTTSISPTLTDRAQVEYLREECGQVS